MEKGLKIGMSLSLHKAIFPMCFFQRDCSKSISKYCIAICHSCTATSVPEASKFRSVWCLLQEHSKQELTFQHWGLCQLSKLPLHYSLYMCIALYLVWLKLIISDVFNQNWTAIFERRYHHRSPSSQRMFLLRPCTSQKLCGTAEESSEKKTKQSSSKLEVQIKSP